MGNIAIITARSGSKGLKDKNIRPMAGKPLLAYTIEAALSSGVFDTVMVSTDSEEYARIARDFGAQVPFLRSVEQSGDSASSWDVVREVLNRYKEQGATYETVALLQPTSPLRTEEDIMQAYQLFQEKCADAVVSVTQVDHPVQWCFALAEDGGMDAFGQCEFRNSRRQELLPYYRENGAIYMVRGDKIQDPDWDIYQKNCYAYKMAQSRSLDIDVLLDFKLAEMLLEMLQ